MKQFVTLSLLLLMLCMSFAGFSQRLQYPFEVKVSGKGAGAIIFIPGFGCAGAVWDASRAKFEKDHTCYTLTMAGFAGVPAQGISTFKEREKAIADFMREKKISKAIIVGHSMGGAWAMALAADYPELVSKIIVVDALPCLAAMRQADFKTKEPNDCSMMVNSITAMKDEDFYKMQKMNLPQLIDDTTKIEMLATWSVTSDRRTFAELYCDFMNTDLRERIGSVQCPALVLLEPSFEKVKPAMNEQFGKMKTADIRYASKGLHFIMYDDKEWFEKQLDSFIQ